MMTLSPLLVCMASLYERALLFYLTGGITIVYDNCVWVRMLLCVSTYVGVCTYVRMLLCVSTYAVVCEYVCCCVWVRMLLCVSTYVVVCEYVCCCVWLRMLLCVSTYVVVCEYVCCFDPAYNRIVSPILVTFSWSSMRSCTFNGM